MRWQAAVNLVLWTATVTAILTSLYWITAYDLLDAGGPVASTRAAASQPFESASRSDGGVAITIPVQGIRAAELVDSWDQSRAQGRLHRAIDIPAPAGTPVLAAIDGRIERLFASDRGGRTLYLRSSDGTLMLYYAHLQGYRRGLAEGDVVERGQVIATVGASGNADPAGPHLHFQVLRTAPGADWNAGVPVNPYPPLAGRAARP
ncbi:MAG: M23 family metallopeptidase [Sphingopyxis sp.]|uniref:M23 family metallopeptidase n=1 Tax=Sphingopyxis sp. TaxID=1908224 RepID=UPI003D80C4BE